MIFLFAIILVIVAGLAAYAGYRLGVRGHVHDAVATRAASSTAAFPSEAAPAPALGREPVAALVPGAADGKASAAAHAGSEPFGPTALSAADLAEIERIGAEKARIIRSRDAEAEALRLELHVARESAQRQDDEASRQERERSRAELARALDDCARYRQLVIDIENNAPPPILAGAGEPDDLKLIVGVGPVLERMLHNLGVTTFRQIARWSARDSAEFDARLPEFPGRIVRDQWVTQARELHLAKFGEPPSDRPSRT